MAERRRLRESGGPGGPERTSGDGAWATPTPARSPERRPPRLASKVDVGHEDVAVLREPGDHGAATRVVEANLAAAEEGAA